MCSLARIRYENSNGTSCAECAFNDGTRRRVVWFESREEYLCIACIEYLVARGYDLTKKGYVKK